MTYHQIVDKSNTNGATIGTETTQLEFTPDFSCGIFVAQYTPDFSCGVGVAQFTPDQY
jgi:hypothetical protein